MSDYKGIAGYYDQLMSAGYYKHEELSQNIQSVIGPRKRLLELGVGTGLMALEMVKSDPSIQLTGIDYSQAMLEIASDRLPDSVCLEECDVAEMNLNRQFEAAFSMGGTWVIIDSDDGLMLGTHLHDSDNDLRGLQNIANHLEPGGLLVLSVHPPHKDYSLELGDGLVYSQEIGEQQGTPEHFLLEKNYRFSKGEEVLAEDQVSLGFYPETVFTEMLDQVGFLPMGMTDAKDFFVYRKKE